MSDLQPPPEQPAHWTPTQRAVLESFPEVVGPFRIIRDRGRFIVVSKHRYFRDYQLRVGGILHRSRSKAACKRWCQAILVSMKLQGETSITLPSIDLHNREQLTVQWPESDVPF